MRRLWPLTARGTGAVALAVGKIVPEISDSSTTWPYAVIGAGYALTPAPTVVARTVVTEGIRAQRMDSETFRLRFAPVVELPPAIEVRHAPRSAEASNAGAVPRLTPAATPPRRLRSRAVRLDVCQRHGMRKVSYGRTWRCRR